jgi:hypothetical protein
LVRFTRAILLNCRMVEIGLMTKSKTMSGGWPMKKERKLIKLARANHSAEQIASKLDAPLPQIFKVARRLGVDLGPEPPKLDRRRGPRAAAGRVRLRKGSE